MLLSSPKCINRLLLQGIRASFVSRAYQCRHPAKHPSIIPTLEGICIRNSTDDAPVSSNSAVYYLNRAALQVPLEGGVSRARTSLYAKNPDKKDPAKDEGSLDPLPFRKKKRSKKTEESSTSSQKSEEDEDEPKDDKK